MLPVARGCWPPCAPWARAGVSCSRFRYASTRCVASTWAAFPDKPWLLPGPALGAVGGGRGAGHRWGPRSEACCSPGAAEERRLSNRSARFSLLDRPQRIRSSSSRRPRAGPTLRGATTSAGEVLGHGSSEFLAWPCCWCSLPDAALGPKPCCRAAGCWPWEGTNPLDSSALMADLSLVVSCAEVDAFLALGVRRPGDLQTRSLLAFCCWGPAQDDRRVLVPVRIPRLAARQRVYLPHSFSAH